MDLNPGPESQAALTKRFSLHTFPAKSLASLTLA
jgi:hypothetical protein